MKLWLCDDQEGVSQYVLAPDWVTAEQICWKLNWEVVGEFVEEIIYEGPEFWTSEDFVEQVDDARDDTFWEDIGWETDDENDSA